jgi:hypothetical protein
MLACKRKSISLLLLLFLAFTGNLFAGGEPAVHYLGIDQGLSNNAVTHIYQDHKGFMWIGTYDGLNRYDGYTFRIFRNIIGDSTSLGSNNIAAIAEDAQHNVWVGGQNGISIYNPVIARFAPPQVKLLVGGTVRRVPYIVDIKAINKDGILVGTQRHGLLFFGEHSDTGVQIPLRGLKGNKGNYYVSAIEYDSVIQG